MNLAEFTIVCGHYGCGKTNLSINLAVEAAKHGEKVVLADLDLVNPYFRSSDYADLLKENGIEMIAPVYAGTTLDLPAVAPELMSVFEHKGKKVILDVGGDDVGATVLGMLSTRIRESDYDMIYVINKYRVLSENVSEATELLREIETASRLKATGVVNNSHLKYETTAKTILESIPFAKQVAKNLALPLLYTCIPDFTKDSLEGKADNLFPVKVYVRSPWE